jgi:NTP pyrophosphatase (non-canonical NTP hydrolase)
VTVAEFQRLIRDIYFDKDSRRGSDGTFRWLVEETGELARAIRRQDRANLDEEFADVFAWLASLATLQGVDLEAAIVKYAAGCPKCHSTPCRCVEPQPASPGCAKGGNQA